MLGIFPACIRAVFFDAVGTLIFPAPSAPQVYADFAARRGVVASEDDVRRRLTAAYLCEENIDRAAGWVTSEAREEERWRRIVAASLPGVADAEACFRDLFEHFAQPAAWRVNPDAPAVLAALTGAGLRVGMGSNYDARLLRVLGGMPKFAPLAGNVVVSSLVGVRKPGRGFFDVVCGIQPPESVAFVGDDYENDYAGAVAAGLYAVLLDEHDRHPTARRVRRLADLLLG